MELSTTYGGMVSSWKSLYLGSKARDASDGQSTEELHQQQQSGLQWLCIPLHPEAPQTFTETNTINY